MCPKAIVPPTDPSLEFYLFEVIRTRPVDALVTRGYDLLEAEKIALGNLSFSVTSEDLHELFSQAGTVETARTCFNKQ